MLKKNKSLENTTALVTGGAGFIGSHLTRALIKKGCRVKVLDNISRNVNCVQDLRTDGTIKFVKGDICDLPLVLQTMKGIDYVFHQASICLRRCNAFPNVAVGNNVKIQNNVSVYEGVELEDGVFCGPSCVFTNVINPRSHISRKSEFKRTIVRKGATIGANATILCGVTIGKYAFVGAGAVVTKDIPKGVLVCGTPAKYRRHIDKDG